MAELFHKGLMDMVVKLGDKNILVANKMKKEDVEEFVEKIKLQYKVKTIEVDSETIDWNKIDTDKLVRVIPTSIDNKRVRYTLITA